MKTKEIEVWVDDTIFEAVEAGQFRYPNVFLGEPADKHNVFKAKLIIDLPPRETTITEDQLDRAIYSCFLGLGEPTGLREKMKEILFGSEKE